MDLLTWDDILWSDEYERGRIYKAEIEYFDGVRMTGTVKYLGPRQAITPVNGLESLIIPEFADVEHILRKGAARYIRIL